MGQYSGANQWVDSIYQFETTDVVQGGPNGVDNKPLKDLADRTTWLYEQMGTVFNLTGDVQKSGNNSITAADQGKMIVAIATGVNTLTIADASTFRHGAIIPISSYCNAGCVINVVGTGGQQFYDLSGWRSAMYMHNREHLILVALTNHFKVISAIGNFYTAGEEVKGRKEMANTIALKGQLLQRNQYPRLWEYVASLTLWQEVTIDAYFWSFGLIYQGFFTTGDEVSTFRLPDERGLFDRMIDLGRGIDYNRYSSYAGGYERDLLQDHFHNVDPNPNANSQSGWGKMTTGNDGPEGTLRIIKSSGPYDNGGSFIGANETTVKNVGKLNLIRF